MGDTIQEVFKINNKVTNHAKKIYWSPMGRYLLFHHDEGDITFFDIKNKCHRKKKHDGSEHIYWSPCGRYVVSTVVTKMLKDKEKIIDEMDNSFVMYNYQGKELSKYNFKIKKDKGKS